MTKPSATSRLLKNNNVVEFTMLLGTDRIKYGDLVRVTRHHISERGEVEQLSTSLETRTSARNYWYQLKKDGYQK